MYQNNEFNIPHTSTCIINTKGKLVDGDIVEITSPIFSSTNYSSGAINLTESFNVPIKINNTNGYIISDGNTKATLVCDDNDIFNMYVKEFM